MLREEKMKIKIVLTILLCFSMTFNVFADLKIDEYFNSLDPQLHVNRIYSNERKEELSGDIVNYDDIEDLIHLYNPEVLNNWNSWKNNKSSQDIYEDYQSAADSLFSSAGSQDSEMQEAMISAQGRAMQIQADKNADDSYTNFLTNYLVEKQLVLSTKILDLNYQKSCYELSNSNETIEEALRKEETASNALQYGNGTQVELLSAKKAVSDAKSSLIMAESNQKTYKRNLVINCGKEISDSIYITPINIFVGELINSIDLNSDYEKTLKNSIQYEIYRRRIENARTEEVKNEYKILYDAAPSKIYNDLENKYTNIFDALDTFNNRELALKLAKDNLNKAKNEFEHGNISAKSLKTAEYNVNVAANNLEASKYDMKIAIETYIYATLGYGDC